MTSVENEVHRAILAHTAYYGDFQTARYLDVSVRYTHGSTLKRDQWMLIDRMPWHRGATYFSDYRRVFFGCWEFSDSKAAEFLWYLHPFSFSFLGSPRFSSRSLGPSPALPGVFLSDRGPGSALLGFLLFFWPPPPIFLMFLDVGRAGRILLLWKRWCQNNKTNNFIFQDSGKGVA